MSSRSDKRKRKARKQRYQSGIDDAQQGSQPKAMTNQNQNGQTYERIKKTKKGRVKIIPMDDSRVIPYNPYLLLKFGCHINIEYVFGQKACKYIFKYLLKGILFLHISNNL